MATQWVLGKISDALQPTIQNGVSTAGTFAGGAFSTVGSGINGVGESINGTIRRYGDGFKDYGNGVMDWTNAPVPRAQTSQNPLGLSGGKSTGKRAVTSPSVYSAPPKPKPSAGKTLTTTSKTAPPQKKIEGAPAKKALPAPSSKPAVTTKKVTNTTAKPATTTPSSVKRPATTKAPVTRTPGPVKASTATATKAKPPSSQKPNYVAAANPLGLT